MEKFVIIARVSFRSEDQKIKVQDKIKERKISVLEKASSYYKIKVNSFSELDAFSRGLPRAVVVEPIKEIETLSKCF